MNYFEKIYLNKLVDKYIKDSENKLKTREVMSKSYGKIK